MNSEILDELMYQAGITAQGCWDELDDYDRDAIMALSRLIVAECVRVCEETRNLTWTVPLKDDEQITACVGAILNHFGMNRGSI